MPGPARAGSKQARGDGDGEREAPNRSGEVDHVRFVSVSAQRYKTGCHPTALPPARLERRRRRSFSEDRETLRAVMHAITESAAREQAVIRMRDLQGCSSEEVCSALDVSSGQSARPAAPRAFARTGSIGDSCPALSHLTCQEIVEVVTDYLEQALPPDSGDDVRGAHELLPRTARSYLQQMRATVAVSRAVSRRRTSPPTTRDAAAVGVPELEEGMIAYKGGSRLFDSRDSSVDHAVIAFPRRPWFSPQPLPFRPSGRGEQKGSPCAAEAPSSLQ